MKPDTPDLETRCVVFLRRRSELPTLAVADLDRIQAAHLAYLNRLHQEDLIFAYGPFQVADEVPLRGLIIFCNGLEWARVIALMSDDPWVVAGRLEFEVIEWTTPAGCLV